MEYFGIDEKVLYPSSSFLSNDGGVSIRKSVFLKIGISSILI